MGNPPKSLQIIENLTKTTPEVKPLLKQKENEELATTRVTEGYKVDSRT